MILLTHRVVAELLFAAGFTPSSTVDAARVIARQFRAHPDVADAVAAMAQEFGDHPETAAARMARCLALAPPRVELPDSYDSAAALRLIGCNRDDCASDGPFQAVGKWLYCADHLADALALIHDGIGGDDDDN